MASQDLIDVSFAESIYGTDLDDERAGALITVASSMVREYAGTAWDSDTVPIRVKVVVAQMVGDALSSTPAETAQVKAEQIGDYRVEYAKAAIAALTIEPHQDVLDDYRVTAYSVNTPLAFDGVDEEDEEDS